jgi:hypothetical protein
MVKKVVNMVVKNRSEKAVKQFRKDIPFLFCFTAFSLRFVTTIFTTLFTIFFTGGLSLVVHHPFCAPLVT